MRTGVNHLEISLQAAEQAAIALCAGLGLGEGAQAPDWLHLLPTGDIRTADGRGPYRVADVGALMAASLPAGERLVLDENHSTDLAAPKGFAAPAMGWITALEQRNDGVWGQVEWTETGRQLVTTRAYRAISPVIAHDKAGTISAILRASLVNKPNLRGLTTLHQESDMSLLDRLLAALGLPAATTEDGVVSAITALHQAQGDQQTALQAQLGPIATAAGLADSASAAAVIAAVTQLVAGDSDSATIVGLQAELSDVTTRLNSLVTSGQRDRAVAFVDGAISGKRVGVKPQRERFITMHMADPAGTEALINDLPALGGTNTLITPPATNPDGEITLHAKQLAVAKMLGLDPKVYAATLKAEQANEETF